MFLCKARYNYSDEFFLLCFISRKDQQKTRIKRNAKKEFNKLKEDN